MNGSSPLRPAGPAGSVLLVGVMYLGWLVVLVGSLMRADREGMGFPSGVVMSLELAGLVLGSMLVPIVLYFRRETSPGHERVFYASLGLMVICVGLIWRAMAK